MGSEATGRIRTWAELSVGVEPELFCRSDPASCRVVFGLEPRTSERRWLSKTTIHPLQALATAPASTTPQIW